MPSPIDSNVQKRKKACRRCRHRKQKCDFEQPCHNCQAARVECEPVIREEYHNYPAGYVQALENHAAILEQTLNGQFPGSAPDHLSPQFNTRPGTGYALPESTGVQSQNLGIHPGSSPETQTAYWQNPQSPSSIADPLMQFGHGFGSHPSPPGVISPVQTMAVMHQSEHNPLLKTAVVRSEGVNEIPTSTAASFFRTYFQFIHPQYPFLDMKVCGDWYTEWKMAPANNPISGWPAFFVKMIFSIGSLIQSKSDTAPRYQHQDLKTQAQSEDFIIRNSESSPLIRLQAMLLSAVCALHSESTARIAHISGAVMRFATLHGFHRLVDLGDEASEIKVRVWSYAYVLDRAASATLDVPVALSDVYISSDLYVYDAQRDMSHALAMPWIDDAPPCDTPAVLPTLRTFAHTCKIRLLQSYIIHTMQAIPLEGGATAEWVESMRIKIEDWSGEISQHSLVNTDSYQSPLWLGLIGQLSRLLLCRPSEININSQVSDVALHASCDVCTTFRALQKKRQVAQPWLVVITQFQAGVTILYIIWSRAVSIPKAADSAIRDCTAVLAILSDRWQNAEIFRDCFEILARAITQSSRPGHLEREARDELVGLTQRVVEAGVNRHVSTMLWEMASSQDDRDDVEI